MISMNEGTVLPGGRRKFHFAQNKAVFNAKEP
jgi:hypothetical protein